MSQQGLSRKPYSGVDSLPVRLRTSNPTPWFLGQEPPLGVVDPPGVPSLPVEEQRPDRTPEKSDPMGDGPMKETQPPPDPGGHPNPVFQVPPEDYPDPVPGV